MSGDSPVAASSGAAISNRTRRHVNVPAEGGYVLSARLLNPGDGSAHLCVKMAISLSYLTSPETTVLTDIADGKLAQVTWIVPDFNNSDHPGAPAQGPDWVATIVNAIGRSQYWDSTTIFISWDDWGGFYDHVPPPQTDDMGLGFRVPVIVVGPYARLGYVSHVNHESSGFLRYMEEVFDLPTLGTRDSTADDFRDCFDYTQPPTPFTPIATKHTVDFFLHQKGSGLPDND